MLPLLAPRSGRSLGLGLVGTVTSDPFVAVPFWGIVRCGVAQVPRGRTCAAAIAILFLRISGDVGVGVFVVVAW